MIETGITRNVDDLGRIVLPMELRRSMGIKVKDPLTIYTEGERIILSKPTEACAICGSAAGEKIEFKDRKICSSCVKELREK